MNNLKTITLTAIVRAGALNYDEGMSVISPLKKINTGSGIKTYMSPQAFKYSLYKVCEDEFGWSLSEVKRIGSGNKKTSQKVSTIIESEEVDMFATMVTFSGGSGYKREAVFRLVPLVSLATYQGDKEILNNMGLSSRINEDPNLATIEIERNLYKYSLTIDFDRLGVDEYKIGFTEAEVKSCFDSENKAKQKAEDINKPSSKKEAMKNLYCLMEQKGFISLSEKEFLKYAGKVKDISFKGYELTAKKASIFSFGIKLTDTERKKRCNNVLDALNHLHRDIRGRRENLAPVFCIGTKGNFRLPIFENIVNIYYIDGKTVVNSDKIRMFCEKEGIKADQYLIGWLSDIFYNKFKATGGSNAEVLPKDVIEFLKV